jgi:hypothetical protein
MPTPTYTPLANVTLGSAASSVTFGSIPATYQDLICVVVATGSTTIQPAMRLNGDSGSNYFRQRMSGNGTSASAASFTADNRMVLGFVPSATTTSAVQVQSNIMDYSATNKHTHVLTRSDNASLGTEAVVTRWVNTAAVTSVTILTNTGNFAIGSTFALYGVIA